MPSSGLETQQPGPASSVPITPAPYMMRVLGTYFMSISSLPMPFCSETTTVCSPTQCMTSGITPSVCVALTIRITISIVGSSAAVGEVWKPVRTHSSPLQRKVRPSAAILSMCALYLSTRYMSAPPRFRYAANTLPAAPEPIIAIFIGLSSSFASFILLPPFEYREGIALVVAVRHKVEARLYMIRHALPCKGGDMQFY